MPNHYSDDLPVVRPITEERTAYGYIAPEFRAAPIEPTEAEQMGEFRKGVNRAIDETQAMAGGALGLLGDVAGVDIIRDFGYDYYKKQMEEAGQYAPAVESLDDINSIDTFIDWLASTAGSVLPSAAGALASGGAGGIIGAGAKTLAKRGLTKKLASGMKQSVRDKVINKGLRRQDALKEALQEFGATASGKITKSTIDNTVENLSQAALGTTMRQAAKRGTQAGVVGFSTTLESGGNWIDDYETNANDTNPVADLAFGFASGLTDLIGGEGLAINAIFGRSVGKKLTRELSEEGAAQVQKGFARTLVNELVKGSLAEGAQEATQESLSILNSYLNTHSIDAVLTPQVFKQIKEAAAAGMVGGALFGGASGMAQVLRRPFSAENHAKNVQQDQELERQQEIAKSPERQKREKYAFESNQYVAQLEKVTAQHKEAQIQLSNLGNLHDISPAAAFRMSNELAGQAAALEDQRKEIEKKLEKSQQNLMQADLDLQAKVQSALQFGGMTQESMQASRNQKDAAYGAMTRDIERSRRALQRYSGRLHIQGAPKAEYVNKVSNVWDKILGVSRQAVEKIEKLPVSESASIGTIATNTVAEVGRLQDYARSIFDSYNVAEDQMAQGRAFYRGRKDQMQELQAANIEQQAEQIRNRQNVRDVVGIVNQATVEELVAEQLQAPTTTQRVGDLAQSPQSQIRQINRTPLDSRTAKAVAKNTNNKKFENATSYEAVATTAANTLSKKGMPFAGDFAGAKLAMDALLPTALNLKPAEGAKWVRDSFLIAPNLKGGKTPPNRGSYVREHGKIVFKLTQASDKSTVFHETAHAYLDNLTDKVNNGWATTRDLNDFKVVKKWLNWKDNQSAFTPAQHEKFAKGFEKYLMTGKAPNQTLKRFFRKVKNWLKDVYKTADEIGVDVSPAMKRVYTNVLTKQRKPAAKKKGTPKVKEGVTREQPLKDKVQEKRETVKKKGTEAKRQVKAAVGRVTSRGAEIKPGVSYLTPEGKIDYTYFDDLKINLQDYYHPIRMVLKAMKEKGGVVSPETNIYAIEEAIPNKLVDALTDFDRQYVKPLEKSIAKYAKQVNKSPKQTQADIDEYLLAQHAEERNNRLAELGNTDPAPSGMRTDRANDILEGRTSIKVTPALKEIGAHMDAMAKRQLEVMREFRLMPKKQVKAMEEAYTHYRPIKGWGDMMERHEGHYKERVRGIKLNLHKALGRTEGTGIDSPMVHMIIQTMDTLNVAIKSDAGRSLLKLIEENKDLKDQDFFFKYLGEAPKKEQWVKNEKTGDIEWKEAPYSDPRIISILNSEGKMVRVQAPDQKVADAFTGNNLAVAPPIVKLLGKLTRTLARLATTLNPAFILTNPMRDVITAAIHIADEAVASKKKKFAISRSQATKNLMGNLRDARKAIIAHTKGPKEVAKLSREWQEALKQFRVRGGFSEQYGLTDYEAVQNQIVKSIEHATDGPVFAYPRNAVRGAIDWMEMHGNALENMTRLATFKTLSDQWLAKDMDSFEAYERAGRAARNITVNFSKRGAWAPMLGPLYMFSNASIQGTARMMKSVARNPKLMSTVLGSAVVSSVMLAQMARFMGGDDDDGVAHFDKIPDWVKNTNMVFMIPGSGGKYVKIPLPYGYNVFNVLGQMIDQVVMGRKDVGAASTEVVYSLFDNFSPVGSPEAGWTTLLPTAIRPLIQIETNKGFFGQKIMPDVPSWIKYDYPDANRYWSTVSPAALMIANWVNWLGGTTETRSGLIDISPETIEHIIESYTGGLGKTATRAAAMLDAAWDAAIHGKEIKSNELIADLPVLRRYISATNFYSTLHEYVEERGNVAALKEEARIAKSRGKSEYAEFKRENPNYRRKVLIMEGADKRLRKLRKLKNSIKRSNRVDKETARLQKIEKMEQKIIKQALKAVGEVD